MNKKMRNEISFLLHIERRIHMSQKEKIINIAVIAHVDAGKSTLVAR